MAALPVILKDLDFKAVSIVSLLYLTKDGNNLFAGVFIKNKQPYFVMYIKGSIVYMELVANNLNRVLKNEISLKNFILNRKNSFIFIHQKSSVYMFWSGFGYGCH